MGVVNLSGKAVTPVNLQGVRVSPVNIHGDPLDGDYSVASSDYERAILSARDAWIAEARADSSIVPLVVHTDQHGKLTADNALFRYLAKAVPWADASACIGLGDTVSNYDVAQFQAMVSCLSGIPANKQINIWGNHDTWFGSSTDNILGEEQLNALNTYFDNSAYPGNHRYNAYGIEYMVDETRKIKYVVIGGWEYDHDLGAWNHYVIGSDSMAAIVEMLSQADGYDVVLLSHIQPFKNRATADWIHPPVEDGDSQGGLGGMSVSVGVVVSPKETSIDQMLIDRKNKASGTVKDSYGNAHNYDFSGCNSDLICCLAGHEHCDKYMWQNANIPVYIFDAYYVDNHPIYLVNIDRARERLNIWKIDDAPTVYNYQIPFEEPAES